MSAPFHRRERWASVALAVLSLTVHAAQAPGAAAQPSGRWGDQSIPAASRSTTLAGQAGGWQFAIGPYLWASGVKGTSGVLGRTAEVDVSFREIVENLDFAFMLPAELRRGLWGVAAEVIYMKLSKGRAVPRPPITGVDFELSQVMIELSPRYRIVQRATWNVDALAGVRFISLEPTLTIEPAGAEFGKRRSWADPIVGARLIADLARQWLVQLRADIGGFGVSSDFTWQALLLGGYRISDRVGLRAGYRYLDVDYESSENEFLYDVATRGAIIGVVIRF